MPDRIAFGFLAVVLVIAAVSDWRTGKIYNGLTYPAIVAGLAFWAVVGGLAGGTSGALDHAGLAFVVMLVAAVPAALLFGLGALGGGDVKLMAAIGAITASWECVYRTMVVAVLIAFVMAVYLMIRHGLVMRTLRRLWGAVLGAFARVKPVFPDDSPKVPLGVALKIGGLLAGVECLLHVKLPWSNW